jgi:hypothetical protein
MTRHALALALVSDDDDAPASVFDRTASDAPRLRLTPRDEPPPLVVPDGYRVLARGGAVVVCESGDRDQPHEATTTHYARDCAESRDPSWWRGLLERGGYGRPWVRLTAYPDVDTMRDGERLATVDAGLPAANLRVVLPREVLVRMPGVGMIYATATDEVRDGIPVVRVAETTWRKLRAALGVGCG